MTEDLEDYAQLLSRIIKADTMLFPDAALARFLITLITRRLEVDGGMNASSLAQATRTPRSSVIRRLGELMERRYVERRDDRLYYATDLAVNTMEIHRDLVMN